MKVPGYRIVNIQEYVHDPSKPPLIVRDMGPWDHYPTITNAAEELVAHLFRINSLHPGRRLLYYDSEGQLDEILIKDGRFAGFAPGPRPAKA